MQNGKKKHIFGTGLNLALALHLVQSLIYPGATFSTVPAKRYECPSMCRGSGSNNNNKKKIYVFDASWILDTSFV